MGATTSNPYEDRTANEPVEDPRNPPPPQKPVVMNPKFVPPPDTQNPFTQRGKFTITKNFKFIINNL